MALRPKRPLLHPRLLRGRSRVQAIVVGPSVLLPNSEPSTGGAPAHSWGSLPNAKDIEKRIGGRRIHGGRRALRTALYLDAMVGYRFNPELKAMHERLRAADKPPRLAFVALARKRLTILNAIARVLIGDDHEFCCRRIQRSTYGSAVQRIGANRRGIAPPESAEPKKVDARTVLRSSEPRYSTPVFNALLSGGWPPARKPRPGGCRRLCLKQRGSLLRRLLELLHQVVVPLAFHLDMSCSTE